MTSTYASDPLGVGVRRERRGGKGREVEFCFSILGLELGLDFDSFRTRICLDEGATGALLGFHVGRSGGGLRSVGRGDGRDERAKGFWGG